MSEKLNTIQKRDKLNEVYPIGEKSHGGVHHTYAVVDAKTYVILESVEFQEGGRCTPNSKSGVTDADLLEMVRDRLKSFQSGPYACRENACALTHIEEALMWMNRRVEDRKERGVLGTMDV